MKGLFPKNIGIHARVLSAAVILISMSTFILGYLGVNIINQFVTQRFNQRIDFMTQYLALNSELGILIDEQNLLQGLANNMLKESDIAGVEIKDNTGRALVSEFRDIEGPFGRVEKKVFLSETEDGGEWIHRMTGGKDINFIGQVYVTYSTKGIENLIFQMKTRFVYIALALTLLSWVIFYFISRSLVAPVISLAETPRKVSMGNRSIRAASGNTPEIRKLADAFNDMLDSLAVGRKTLMQAHEKVTRQEALAEVGKFSLMIAHEVKNPLGIIKSSLEMMKADLNIPKDNIPLTYAEEEIVRLNTLIESFLIFSRPAKPNFALVDLNRMMEQVIMGFEIQYASDDIQLNYKIPETAFDTEADFDLLARGISNIIKNACEANNKKGIVAIQFKKRQNKWQLLITDQGPGIKREDRNKIFEPFFTTKATGTGLGLAFADQVVKAHGGSISIETPDEEGCRFCITLFSNTHERKIEVLEENGRFTDS
ncbi:MAG: HAMP domain-containing sensor histidine kinase [Desulfobacula sp.]|jgi:signal transduction histidine kinase|nr:HAMP domain-containing sensor histidine kinase [Desulfobacula sp.]